MPEIYYVDTYFHAYICPNHLNERWDVSMTSADKPPYCIPCEILRLRKENAEKQNTIDKLIIVVEELKKKAIWCGDDRRR